MTSNQLVPIVIEKSGRGERAYDIYSRLLKDRIILLNGPVTDDSAGTIIAQLLFLSNDDPKTDIQFYINSPGGSVSAGLGVIDTMKHLRCDVATTCIGMADRRRPADHQIRPRRKSEAFELQHSRPAPALSRHTHGR